MSVVSLAAGATTLDAAREDYRAWQRAAGALWRRWAAQGLHLTTDLGYTTGGEWPPVVAALRAVEFGLRFGYPTCCVQEYACDVLDGRHAAMRRGSVPLGARGAVYVPCSACCATIGREVPS